MPKYVYANYDSKESFDCLVNYNPPMIEMNGETKNLIETDMSMEQSDWYKFFSNVKMVQNDNLGYNIVVGVFPSAEL